MNREIYKICFSFINQIETAKAKIGNLIQLIPLLMETSESEDNKPEKIEVAKKRIAHLTHLIFNQDHEKFIEDFIKNETAINDIKKSAKDLLSIIMNGRSIQQ